MKLGVPTMILALAIGFPFAVSAGLAPDDDGDGVPDVLDNCSTVSNAAPLDCDTDNDGYGNMCDTDYDDNSETDINDFVNDFYPAFQAMTGGQTDHDCNGVTDINDFVNQFYPAFQVMAPSGPSGLSCAGTAPCP